MKNYSNLTTAIILFVSLPWISHSNVVLLKQLKSAGGPKAPKNSRAKLIDSHASTRYLKEDKFIPGLSAKKRLFMDHKEEKKHHSPGKTRAEREYKYGIYKLVDNSVTGRRENVDAWNGRRQRAEERDRGT